MTLIEQILELNPIFTLGHTPELEGYYIFKLKNGKYDTGYYLSEGCTGKNCRLIVGHPIENIVSYTIISPVYRGKAPYNVVGPYEGIINEKRKRRKI
jgi:hypothetical protein